MRNRKFSKGKKFIFFLPVIALIATALGYVVMYLWNWILPEIAHTGRLNFWQALGLLVLCRILFGNFNKGGGHKGFGGHGGLREKWQQMDAEQRDRFREEYKKRCGEGWRNRNKE